MNLDDLIERLEAVRERRDGDGGCKVWVAMQPNYPIALELVGVIDNSERGRFMEDEDGEDFGGDHHDEDDELVWITTDGSPYPDGYAPRWVFEATS